MRLLSLLFVATGVLASIPCKAGVVFLPDASESIGLSGSVGDQQQCKNAGYTYTSCPGGKAAADSECKWANGYYNACCINGLKYTTNNCGKGTSPNTSTCTSNIYCN